MCHKFLICCLLLALGCATAPAQNQRIYLEIKTFEQARYKALLANDLESLGTFIAPELIYTHSNGTVEDRTAYFSALRNGKYKFSRFETDSTSYRFIGKKTVVATGKAHIAGLVNGKDFDINARFSAVYVRRKKNWLLHTWQTTRIP